MLLILVLFSVGVTNSDAISQCPTLVVPQHGFLLSGHCERHVGSLCGFGCLTGYRLTTGDSLHECQSNGTWSGLPPKCEEIHCLPLRTDLQVIQECLPTPNGIGAKVGTKCHARCNHSDDRLLGPRTRECLILGRWSGYEQLCIVTNQTNVSTVTSTVTTSPSTTTTPVYRDYSNLTLSVESTDAGIILPHFQSSQFSIVFWFYLRSNPNATLVSLRSMTNEKVFEIVVRANKLVYYHRSRNQTQPSLVKISSSKWTHFAWTYSMQTKQSYLYVDGVRQQSFDFGIVNFDFKNVSSLILFAPPSDGLVTRVEIWNQKISEQQLLVSFRDCRKQIGNVFSWSKVSNTAVMDTKKLRASRFCFGCSEPASIYGGTYYVSDYKVGASVDYRCNFSYEMVGANRAFCMVPSEWHPLPPICKYNPCTITCESCDRKTGVCLRQQTRFDSDACDPPCDEDEECIDGECTWTNTGGNWNSNQNSKICSPPCPFGVPCVNGRCQSSTLPSCSVPCRAGQQCVDGRCGCYRGLCDGGRSCYEICETGERCHNWSCSCGLRGKCGQGESCLFDICMCGKRRGGCQPHEHCLNGLCVCKTNFCDQCGNKCKANEICLDGKCVCKQECEKVFCPFPCLNGGRCTGFYQCTCRQDWTGHRCERRQQENGTVS